MRMIVMMLGVFLAMVQMANAAPQTEAEARLQITKLSGALMCILMG